MKNWFKNLDPDNDIYHRTFIIILAFIILPIIPVLISLFIIWLIVITGI